MHQWSRLHLEVGRKVVVQKWRSRAGGWGWGWGWGLGAGGWGWGLGLGLGLGLDGHFPILYFK